LATREKAARLEDDVILINQLDEDAPVDKPYLITLLSKQKKLLWPYGVHMKMLSQLAFKNS
jgi:hypothetical protein